MTRQPLVSIIVPVYNVAAYINRCMDSLINQTYRNIEVIAVDDGADDGSGEILDGYAEKDRRVEIVHQKNAGLSSARNSGMKRMKGEYVLFVDGDDYLEKDAVKVLTEKLADTVEVVLFPYIREYENRKVFVPLFPAGSIVFSDADVERRLLSFLIGPDVNNGKIDPLKIDRLNTAWGKLYKSSLLDGMEFLDTEIIGIEDGWFNINVFKKITGKVIYTQDTWYRYEKRNTASLLHRFKDGYMKKRWCFYYKVGDFLTDNGLEKFRVNLSYRIVLELFGIILNFNNMGMSVWETKKEFEENLQKYPYDECFKSIELDRLYTFWRIFYKLCESGRYLPLVILVRMASKVRG